MRRRLTILGVGALMIAGATLIAQEVTSVNAVGFVRTTCERGKYKLMCVNFDTMAASSAISNILDATQLASGTKVYIWDAASQSYSNNIPTIVTFPPPTRWSPGNATVTRGDAFWVLVPASAPLTSYVVTVHGEVPPDTNAVEVISPGFSFLSYNYPVRNLLTNLSLRTGIKSGDKIYAWRNNGWVSETWVTFPPPARWSPGTNINYVEMGEGLVYQSGTLTNRPWMEIKPYVWP